MLYVTTLSARGRVMSRLRFLRKHQNGLPVAPREYALGRLAPRQPLRRQVLARGEPHRQGPGNLEAEHMLGIVRDALVFAEEPYGIDFVNVLQVPRFEAIEAGGGARFLPHPAGR